jgi:hypothetical protein
MITALHHVGHVVRDLGAAMDLYARLGFSLPPPTCPALPPADGLPPEPLGAANTHAHFPGAFVELLTVVGEGAATRLPGVTRVSPLQVPADRLPAFRSAIEATTADLAAALARFEGAHILMLTPDDIDATAARLRADGVAHGGVHTAQRSVETAGGTRTSPVRFLELDGTGVPEGRVGYAQNAGDGAGVAHPNGAVDLVESVLCVAAHDLPAAERRYERYLNRPARRDGERRTFDLAAAQVTLITPAGLADLLPGERPPALPAFAAYAVAVRDLAAAGRLLRDADVPVRESPAGDLFVPAAAALGVAIVFRQLVSR